MRSSTTVLHALFFNNRFCHCFARSADEMSKRVAMYNIRFANHYRAAVSHMQDLCFLFCLLYLVRTGPILCVASSTRVSSSLHAVQIPSFSPAEHGMAHVQNNLMYRVEDGHCSKQKFCLHNVLHISAHYDLPCAGRSSHHVEHLDLPVWCWASSFQCCLVWTGAS